MRRILSFIVVVATGATAIDSIPALAASNNPILTRDVPRGSDSPLVGRYEGSVLIGEKQTAFDEIALPSGPAQGSPWGDHKLSASITAQGRLTQLLYVAPPGRSTLEVAANYADALKSHGFEQVWACAAADCGESFVAIEYPHVSALMAPTYDQIRQYTISAALETVSEPRYALFRQADQAASSYVAVYVGQQRSGTHGTFSEALDGRVMVRVDALVPKPMESKIVTLSATEINDKITSEGRVALYGIFFDFNKSDLKPESAPQLVQMAAYIKAHTSGRVFITGHTDSQGALELNLGLSQRRAEAVMKTLEKSYGVDPRRVAARGLASLAPLSSNATEDGRAKNRRVELVGG